MVGQVSDLSVGSTVKVARSALFWQDRNRIADTTMPKKIRWGVLGVAKIATVKVIPAMQRGTLSEIAAIASRDARRAEQAAADRNLEKESSRRCQTNH